MSLKSMSSLLAAQPPEVSAIGPFLSSHRPGHIRICIGLPGSETEAGLQHRNIPALRCELLHNGQPLRDATSKPRHAVYRTFVFDFENLPAGTTLHYRFSTEGHPLILEDGLLESDCRFQTHGPWTDTDSLVLCSCHNPYELAGHERKSRLRLLWHRISTWKASQTGQELPKLPDTLDQPRWTMWTKLRGLIDADPSLRLLILGGDQLYNDDVETEFLGKLPPRRANKAFVDALRRRFIRQYQLYWQHPDYRKVLARLPSVAMWDDHDITDGWGGRESSFKGFKGEAFAPRWRLYYRVAQEAFRHYQAVRNPDPLPLPKGIHTTRLNLSPLGSVVLTDLRSEKNSRLKRLVSTEHEDQLGALLDSGPGHILFFLVPVVPVRTNLGHDERLVGALKAWLILQTFFSRYPLLPYFASLMTDKLLVTSLLAFGLLIAYGDTVRERAELFAGGLFLGILFLLVQGVMTAFNSRVLPELTDDMEDGLSAGENRPVLNRLLQRLFSWQRGAAGRQALIMTGDIHTLGISEILEEDAQGNIESIPQIVSSPMAYYPMPKPVEGFTTSTSEMVLEEKNGRRRYARNITYVSKRNFCQIIPGRIGKPGPHPIRFHLDGHRHPLEFPVKFTEGN